MEHQNETHTICPGCGGSFWFPNEGLGLTAACPHCRREVKLEPRAKKVEPPMPAPKPATKPEREATVPSVSVAKPPSNSKNNPWLILIALLLLAGIILHEREIKKAEFPSWDYKGFEFEKAPFENGEFRYTIEACLEKWSRTTNGSLDKLIPGYSSTCYSVANVLDVLGGDGWEYVGFLQGEYVVKRQRGSGEWDTFSVSRKYKK